MKRPIKRRTFSRIITVTELIFFLPHMARSYYTYELQYEGKPFYVGKGKGRRMYCHRTEAKNLYETDGDKTIKIGFIHDIWDNENDFVEVKTREHLTNRESLEFEVEDIAKYGRICDGTGILTNMTKGGEGCFLWTEEIRDLVYIKQNRSIPIKYCAICQEIFYKKSSNEQWEKQEYCSMKCSAQGRIKFIEIKYCEWCGKVYGRNGKTQKLWDRSHFCGGECQVAAQKKNHTKIKWCKHCNNVFHQNNYSEKEWEKVELCSDCYKIIRKKNYTEIKWCEKCNTVFHKHKGINRKDWEERAKCQKCILSELNTGKICTEEHKEKVSKAKLGKKHKNPRKTIDQDYKNRISETQRKNHQLKKEGKRIVKEKEYEDRYGYCEIKYCIRCKKVFGRFKKMSTRDWNKKKYCCHSCGVNKKA